MGKIIVFLSLAFSSAAFAKMDPCEVIIHTGRRPAESDHFQIEFAKTWVETQGGIFNDPNVSQWSQINILERWQSWRNVTRTQRDRALALELMKISTPPTPDQMGIVQFDKFVFDRKSLEALSAQNLARMLARVNELFPAPQIPNPELNQTANKILSRVRFGYIRPANPYQFAIAPHGYDAPIASPRELAALGLDRASGYYSKLVGTSPSVEFMFQIAKNDGISPASLTRREVFSLDTKFAQENGFVIPRFHSALDLIEFFEFWNPEATEQMFRANWINLPKDIRAYEQFRVFLHNAQDHEEIFAPANAYTQMAALRTQLRNFVLTPDDGEQFIKQSFKRMVASIGSQNPIEVEKLSARLTNSVAINRFFVGDLMALLHIPYGMGLRIPIAVTASHYVLSRREEERNPYPPRQFHPSGPPQLDHNSPQKK